MSETDCPFCRRIAEGMYDLVGAERPSLTVGPHAASTVKIGRIRNLELRQRESLVSTVAVQPDPSLITLS